MYNPSPRNGTNPASIVVGPIPKPTSTLTQGDLPYDVYKIRMSYLHCTGHDVLPSSWQDTSRAASPSTDPNDNGFVFNIKGFAKNKKVRRHGPTLKLVVDWSAERIGIPPEIPDPCPNDCNYVLLETGISLDEVEPIVGVGYAHKIAGKYIYKVKDTTLVPLAAALPPFIVAEIRAKVDAGTGRLSDKARTAYEKQVAAIDEQITAAENLLAIYSNPNHYYDVHPAVTPTGPYMPMPIENPTPGPGVIRTEASEIIREQAVRHQQEVIAGLLAEKAKILALIEAVQSTSTSRRREGDYTLNADVIWFRLKTLKPGPLFEDCECSAEHVLTGSVTPLDGAVLIGGGGNWSDPVNNAGGTGQLNTTP